MLKRARPTTGDTRRATNVSLSGHLLGDVWTLEVNISRVAEQGLAQAITERWAALWLQENQDSLTSPNALVEQRGLPLMQY